MSYEVELKYRAGHHADLAARLEALGGVRGKDAFQEDVYLNHPARDFAQTGEALRLRRIGDENRITYKGPRWSGPTKTRQEIEIAFARGATAFAEMLGLIEILGFRNTASVRKTRSSFRLTFQGRPVEVALDVAEGLGEFAEVEAIAASKDDLPAAQKAVLDLAGTLGLTELEPRSYLRMVLERS
jgi:adenylate cyclase class 2